MTGTTAAPTADTGPTTLICPRASPRYSTSVPVPPASPLPRPQPMARAVGPGAPDPMSTAQASTVATAEPTMLTRAGPKRRAATPPAKSELP
jgi:hypothetical protein